MRGLVVAVVGALGLEALWHRLRRRQHAELEPAVDLGPDPAGELRARLAESRAADEVVDAEPPEESPADPQARRRDVHARARASIDELKG